jgi:hypothetical protein
MISQLHFDATFIAYTSVIQILKRGQYTFHYTLTGWRGIDIGSYQSVASPEGRHGDGHGTLYLLRRGRGEARTAEWKVRRRPFEPHRIPLLGTLCVAAGLLASGSNLRRHCGEARDGQRSRPLTATVNEEFHRVLRAGRRIVNFHETEEE